MVLCLALNTPWLSWALLPGGTSGHLSTQELDQQSVKHCPLPGWDTGSRGRGVGQGMALQGQGQTYHCLPKCLKTSIFPDSHTSEPEMFFSSGETGYLSLFYRHHCLVKGNTHFYLLIIQKRLFSWRTEDGSPNIEQLNMAEGSGDLIVQPIFDQR